MSLRDAGNTDQNQPCSTAGRNHTRPSACKASMITKRITDTGIMEITDEQLMPDITDLLGREFVCYGYRKVCKYLQKSGHIINRKKVFRIMEENNLLNYRYNNRSPARMVVESIVSVQKPNDVWENSNVCSLESSGEQVSLIHSIHRICNRRSMISPSRFFIFILQQCDLM